MLQLVELRNYFHMQGAIFNAIFNVTRTSLVNSYLKNKQQKGGNKGHIRGFTLTAVEIVSITYYEMQTFQT